MKRFIFYILSICIWSTSLGQTTITMEKIGGVYYVPGEINGLPLKFILDTGASDVYLSLTEAMFMVKNGYLKESDFGNKSYSQIANGQIVENTEVILKKMKVGSVTINNVKAMISNSIEAPVLLGQSAIQKLGPIQLNGNKLIVMNGRSNNTGSSSSSSMSSSSTSNKRIFVYRNQKIDLDKFIDDCDYNFESWLRSRDVDLKKYSAQIHTAYNKMMKAFREGRVRMNGSRSFSIEGDPTITNDNSGKFDAYGFVVNFFILALDHQRPLP